MQKNVIKNSFQYSLERSVPILIGFFPVGTVYGLMMSAAGYNWLWSAAASVFVYAGSLQMLMISFFKSNMSLLTVAVTALLLNSRHIFYGISFIEKFRSYGAWRWFLIYGMPDESYSLLCSYVPREGVEEKWVHIFSTGLIWFYWVAFSVLGGLVGSLVSFNTDGLDFALTALFIVILLDQIKAGGTKLPAIIGIVSSVVCIIILGADNFLLPSLGVTVLALLIVRNKLEGGAENEH